MSSPQKTPESHTDSASEPSADDRYNARLGLWLFAVYLLGYGGFMYLSAFCPTIIGWRPFGGINLAIHYGMSLIAGALVLALVYLKLARGGKDAA